MSALRSRSFAIWRSGLFVLAVYAMLLQAFFGAIVTAAQAHPGVAFDGSALCVGASGASDPASPVSHDRSCCAAACHVGGLWVPAPPPAATPPCVTLGVDLAPARVAAASRVARVTPPARGPPHDAIRLPS